MESPQTAPAASAGESGERRAHWRLQQELMRASGIREFAACLNAFAFDELGVGRLRVLWSTAGDDLRAASSEPAAALTEAEGDMLQWALQSGETARVGLGDQSERLAIVLSGKADTAWMALLIEHDENAEELAGPRWQDFQLLAQAGAASALEAERLTQTVTRLQSAERLQRALYAIAGLASSELDMGEVLHGIHDIVGGLMYAKNFSIVFYDEHRDSMRFAYFVDSVDTDVPDPNREIPLADFPNSLTVATLRQARPLMGPSAQLLDELGLRNEDWLGPDSVDWLGVPMLSGGSVRGAIVVQSYDADVRFGEQDAALLGYVAQHILSALQNKHAQAELELRVDQRTRELRDEVRERARSERLQSALFRIAELSTSTASLADFLAAVHAIVGELLYARNFFVALLNADGKHIDYPYAVDEEGDDFTSREIGRGLTEYVIRQGQPLLASSADIEQLIALGEVEALGPPAVCWLGVPLLQDGHAVGALVVQSYTPGVLFTPGDKDLLTFVCLHVASAMERKQAQDGLRSANAELSDTLARLRRTQGQLVEAEKMASLGGLVAGVAHEINTPLGVSLTAASHLAEEARRLRKRLDSGELSRADLEAFGNRANDACDLVVRNLQRASQLVKSFKQVAVDQSVDQPRAVELDAELRNILAMLTPALKSTPHKVELQCAERIALMLPAGALYQIVSNLVMNTVHHAFPPGQSGHVRLDVHREGDEIVLSCADDGVGMTESVRAQIFDPFFTTRRGEGGTGLGLHILYNVVTQALRGSVVCRSTPGRGTVFEIRWMPQPI